MNEPTAISFGDLLKYFAEIRERAEELTGDVEHLIDGYQLTPETHSHAKHIALTLGRAAELLKTVHNVEKGAVQQ